MKKGILFCCFDTETTTGKKINYSALLKVFAFEYKRTLNYPIAVITDEFIDNPHIDEQIIINPPVGNSRSSLCDGVHVEYEWKNNVKQMAYAFSPFDRTLLLDADYLIGSDLLSTVLECDSEFMIAKRVYDVSNTDSFEKYTWMPNRTIPHCWATVMVWDKEKAKPYFEFARQIEQNYEYYANVFGFNKNQFRNDFVYSIVAHVMGADDIPFAIPTLPSRFNNGTISTIQSTVNGHKKMMKLTSCHDGKDVVYQIGDAHVLSKDFITKQ